MNIQYQNAKNSLRITLVAVAALSATMLAGVTHAAGPRDNAPTRAVTYKDLDLNSKAGVHALYKRIERAADQVCGDVDVRDLQRMSVKKVCVERAVSNAVAAVSSPMLTQMYLAKSGDPVPQSHPIAQIR